MAALCRGLRFDGDITLKDVAMAFQLRDAYDWDEDLEATAKEVRAGASSDMPCDMCLSSCGRAASCFIVMFMHTDDACMWGMIEV